MLLINNVVQIHFDAVLTMFDTDLIMLDEVPIHTATELVSLKSQFTPSFSLLHSNPSPPVPQYLHS
jgi:hypothetical protein